jgi:precorrin isomerase
VIGLPYRDKFAINSVVDCIFCKSIANMPEDKVEAIEHVESTHHDAKVNSVAIEEFLHAEKEMTTWQAVKAHRRLLLFGEAPSALAAVCPTALQLLTESNT